MFICVIVLRYYALLPNNSIQINDLELSFFSVSSSYLLYTEPAQLIEARKLGLGL